MERLFRDLLLLLANEGPISNGGEEKYSGAAMGFGADDLPYIIIVMIVIIALAGYVIYMYHKKPEDEE